MATELERPIDRLLRWASEADMNQVELAERLGVQPGHVTNWKSRGLPADRYVPAADLFHRSVDELLGRVPERGFRLQLNKVYSLQRIKVIGIATLRNDGYWTQVQQNPGGTGGGFINMPSHDQGAYAVRIVGDSNESRVRSGEYVVVEPAHELVAGEEVLLITRDGRSMIRDFLYRRDGNVAVQNIRGERLTFLESEIDQVSYIAAIAKHALYSEK